LLGFHQGVDVFTYQSFAFAGMREEQKRREHDYWTNERTGRHIAEWNSDRASHFHNRRSEE